MSFRGSGFIWASPFAWQNACQITAGCPVFTPHIRSESRSHLGYTQTFFSFDLSARMLRTEAHSSAWHFWSLQTAHSFAGLGARSRIRNIGPAFPRRSAAQDRIKYPSEPDSDPARYAHHQTATAADSH